MPEKYRVTTEDGVYEITVGDEPAPTESHPIKAGLQEFGSQINPLGILKGTAQAVNHPIDTIKTDANARAGIFGQAKKDFGKGDYLTGTRHGIESLIPLLGPALSRYGDLAGSGDTESIGRAVGGTLGLATTIAAPELIPRALPKGGKVSGKLYQSALKPPPGSNTTAEVNSMVKTGLKENIPVSTAGLKKLDNLVADLQAKVDAVVKSKPGTTISRNAVTNRLAGTADRFATQVNPTADVNAVLSSGREFIDTKPPRIPVEQAQKLKTGTYTQLNSKAYGELKSAAVESQKNLARGLKEEIEAIFPEVKGMNAREGAALNLRPELERAIRRIDNHDLLGLGTLGTAGAAGVAFGEQGLTAAATLGVLYRVLGDPAVKSRIAIQLSKASGGSLKIPQAVARINGYLNAVGNNRQGPPK